MSDRKLLEVFKRFWQEQADLEARLYEAIQGLAQRNPPPVPIEEHKLPPWNGKK